MNHDQLIAIMAATIWAGTLQEDGSNDVSYWAAIKQAAEIVDVMHDFPEAYKQ